MLPSTLRLPAFLMVEAILTIALVKRMMSTLRLATACVESLIVGEETSTSDKSPQRVVHASQRHRRSRSNGQLCNSLLQALFKLLHTMLQAPQVPVSQQI